VNPKNFFAELKRRNVYKVAIAYAVVAWLLMQIATQVFPFLEIPNWAIRLVIMLIVIGFPIAFVIAWAFELTPEGLRRTEFADELPKKSARTRVWLYVVVVAAALSVGVFFLGRYTSSKQSAELPEKSRVAYASALALSSLFSTTIRRPAFLLAQRLRAAAAILARVAADMCRRPLPLAEPNEVVRLSSAASRFSSVSCSLQAVRSLSGSKPIRWDYVSHWNIATFQTHVLRMSQVLTTCVNPT
jgi:hypothetical protein